MFIRYLTELLCDPFQENSKNFVNTVSSFQGEMIPKGLSKKMHGYSIIYWPTQKEEGKII